MQPIAPLTIADFKDKSKKKVNKIEIFIDPDWIDLCNLDGKNYLVEARYSTGQWKFTYEPIAASFTMILDDTEGLLNPRNTDSPYHAYLKAGRRIRFKTGFKKSGTDHVWQWIEAVVSRVEIERGNKQITVEGFDYTQYLIDTKLKSPDNYWGTSVTKSTLAGKAEYSMPADCNGAYVAYLNGVQIYDSYHWTYDQISNKFIFLPDSIPSENGTDNLIIYYYTDQVPENVVADLLVAAKLYPDRTSALADMDYEATGVIIKRVKFNPGVSILYAIHKMCERVDYEFFFKYNTKPFFKAIV